MYMKVQKQLRKTHMNFKRQRKSKYLKSEDTSEKSRDFNKKLQKMGYCLYRSSTGQRKISAMVKL